MHLFNRRIITVFGLTLISINLLAQNPNRKGGQNMNMGHFYGKIIETSTSKAIEAASVQLIQNKFDSVTKKKSDVIIAGMLTDKRGEFSLENLPVMGIFKLKISAIGFLPYESKVNFDINNEFAYSYKFKKSLNQVYLAANCYYNDILEIIDN